MQTAAGEPPPGDPPWTDESLFDAGVVEAIETRLTKALPDRRILARLAALAAIVGWLAPLVLSLAQELFGGAAFASFSRDVGMHARSLVAAPILVIAAATCVPRLGQIARHFLDSGIVMPADAGRFERAIGSTLRLRNSALPPVIILALAALAAMSVFGTVPRYTVPAWHRGEAGGLSAAGWWHACVSLPMLLAILFDWLWRVFLWTRFLWRVSYLDLALVPSHPDQAAGLRFVGYSAQAFAPVALALGTIAAGSMANRILLDGTAPKNLIYVLVTLAVLVLILFVGPLLVFSRQLLRAWKRGTFEYGALTTHVGREFERKWLRGDIGESALAAPDFSATTDLYDVAAHVWEVRIIPIGFMSLAMLLVAAMLPFLLVAAMFTPVDVIIRNVAGLLL
jgi:hypothetical protein